MNQSMGICVGLKRGSYAYGCDALGSVVDLDIAAETASRGHDADRMVWSCDFVVLVFEKMC